MVIFFTLDHVLFTCCKHSSSCFQFESEATSPLRQDSRWSGVLHIHKDWRSLTFHTEILQSTTLTWCLGHRDTEISNNTDLVPGSPRHWNLQQHWPGAWVTETLKSPTTLTWCLGHRDTEISNNTDLVPGSQRHWNLQQHLLVPGSQRH